MHHVAASVRASWFNRLEPKNKFTANCTSKNNTDCQAVTWLKLIPQIEDLILERIEI